MKAHGRRAWSIVTLGLRSLVSTFAHVIAREEPEALELAELLMPVQTPTSETIGY